MSIPTLVLSLVHITGDRSWIRGELRPQGLFLNEVQGFMSQDAKAQVRVRALDVIRKHRDGGPGTNLAHGGSLIFHSECQMRYMSGCLEALIAGGHRAMEPTQAAHDDYYARTQKELEGLVWSHPSIEHSWYKNSEGKIHILSPWRLVDYWAWTKAPDLRDFELS